MPPSRHRRYKNILLKNKQDTKKIIKPKNVTNNSRCVNNPYQTKCNRGRWPLTLHTANCDEIHQNVIPADNWNHEDIQQLDPSIINELRECGEVLEVVLSKYLNQPWEKFYAALMEDIGDNKLQL